MSWTPGPPPSATSIVYSGSFIQGSVIPPTSTTIYTFTNADAGTWLAWGGDQTFTNAAGSILVLVAPSGAPSTITNTTTGVLLTLFGFNLIASTTVPGDTVNWTLTKLV